MILRLPLYVRALTQLQREGQSVVSSQQLGERLQMTPAQIRKDLSYFGRFGKQGRGYGIAFLLEELRDILGLNGEWRACLVGVGRLGRAIINYTGFAPEGVHDCRGARQLGRAGWGVSRRVVCAPYEGSGGSGG